jgi:hypothetical protein
MGRVTQSPGALVCVNSLLFADCLVARSLVVGPSHLRERVSRTFWQVVGELMYVIVDAAAQLPKGYCSPWL